MNILLFAGTGEGRALAERLASMPVRLTVSVATGYGHELLVGLPENCHVVVGRRDAASMRDLMTQIRADLVIDATHPYAVEASESITRATEDAGLPRLRLIRDASAVGDAVHVDSAEAAAAILADSEGNILLTTGSSHLDAFTRIPYFAERTYIRVLPMEEALRQCVSLGYRQSHVIAMQGPFSLELNLALLRHFDIRHLVTKDGGRAGGFPEKMRAAAEAEVRVLVIGRPVLEKGMDLDGVLNAVRQRMESGT